MNFKQFSAEKKKVYENIIFLFIVQATNYILPLITLPYLVRVLGPEKFGLIAFAQAFIQYFIIVTDYGFVHTAPRRIAVCRDNNEKLSQIFNSVLLIKFILLLISLAVLVLLVLTIPRFRGDWDIYFITFSMVLGYVLFPIWFFQGMEMMKYITLLNFLSKLIFTIAIFVFVKTQADYLYVPLFNSLGMISAGILGLWIIIRGHKVKIVIPTKKTTYEELKESRHVFWGMSAVSLYSTSNTFILGLFANNTIVGYFKAGETIVRALVSLVSPISQGMYPYVSRLAGISKKKAVDFIIKVVVTVGFAAFILGVMIFVFAPEIVSVFLGPQYRNSVVVLQILSPLPFLMGICSILAVQGLLAFNMDKEFSKIVTITGVFNIAVALLLTPTYKDIGISLSLLLSEVFAAIAVFLYLRQKSFFKVATTN